MHTQKLPIVAIIGRPNVGKSTLFNRIAGGRKAIVHDQPGATRDRNYQKVSWEQSSFMLVDTGGFAPGDSAWDASKVTSQAEKAVLEADAVIFLVDAAAGLTSQDKEVAAILRRGGKRIYLAVNKVDHVSREVLAADFAALGFDHAYAVSAEHGLGIGDLLDDVITGFPRAEPGDETEAVPRVAVIGRPNVGKSTLINRFLGEERLITHHEPGTTRDSVDTLVKFQGSNYELVDTAGIRRRGKVREPIEKYSVLRAQKAISRSDLCLLIIDSTEMVTEQDMKIAGLIQKAGKGCIILLNKWDLVTNFDRGAATTLAEEALHFMQHVPVLCISAKSGQGVHKIFPMVDEIFRQLTRSIPTPQLNRFLYESTKAYKPASYHGKAVSFGYMTQARTNPPTFVVMTNEPKRVHFTYRRYLLNRLREEFGFKGVTVILRFRAKKGSRK